MILPRLFALSASISSALAAGKIFRNDEAIFPLRTAPREGVTGSIAALRPGHLRTRTGLIGRDRDETTTRSTKKDEEIGRNGFLQIRERVSGALLAAGDDGNLRLVAQGSTAGVNFITTDGNNTMLDQQERFLHYFPDTMSTYGVSRFRVASDTRFPKTANLISLNLVDVAGVLNLCVAIDTLGNFFFPAICYFEDQDPKIFLVKDPVAGVDTLSAVPSLSYTVTGGVAQNCSAVVLTGLQ
ncbi:hypothetical protein GQ53DRAFT_822804 [Thozetella sp. PMI_491]|nr:hypothetical protein GQ53DRAFT_822804 [Thozetella sp. PMI_491]